MLCALVWLWLNVVFYLVSLCWLVGWSVWGGKGERMARCVFLCWTGCCGWTDVEARSLRRRGVPLVALSCTSSFGRERIASACRHVPLCTHIRSRCARVYTFWASRTDRTLDLENTCPSLPQAVDASIRAGLWGLALLIAAQCPVPAPGAPAPAGSGGGDAAAPPQPPYQRVVRLYANAFLHTGTPLHTMALAFSGQAGSAIKHGGKSLGGGAGGAGAAAGIGGGVEMAHSGGFEDSWMVTAALVVSNKVCTQML